ncbi:unnamed protein product [Blepharisma stoltei]|uniref:Galactose oxidase n=1 Tax=Blepharisma stoltei TaxID=1481888 RepID=A0AAU9JYU1_9CILI|nr:unnamed protein product [Blepharisma stoltei]
MDHLLKVPNNPFELHIDTSPLDDSESSLNHWEEIRFLGRHPSRRSYHSAASWNEKILIYGGQDLREGPQSGLWSLNLREAYFDAEPWEEIEIPGLGPLCRHSAIVKDDKMYVFGGSNGDREFNTTSVIDLNSRSLTVIPPERPDLPPSLDSHTACLYEDVASSMVVFGGFAEGVRSNTVYILNLSTQKWKRAQTDEEPSPRSNHSSVVYNHCLYIFGGSDDEGEKLCDLWKLDLRTYHWEKIIGHGQIPTGRSGHSAIVFKDDMVIFGGMRDITKETNDMFSFDFLTNTWTMFQFEFQIKDPVTPEQLEEYKKRKSINHNHKHKTVPEPTSPAKTPSLHISKSPDASPVGEGLSFLKKKNSLYDGPPSPLEGRIRGKPPHPRDGHSAVVVNNFMYVFGGDRHQMPFNDLYAYRLVETTIKTPVQT